MNDLTEAICVICEAEEARSGMRNGSAGRSMMSTSYFALGKKPWSRKTKKGVLRETANPKRS